MKNKYIVRSILVIILISSAINVSTQEKKGDKPFEKTIFPELLIDTHKGDKNENYILYEPSSLTTDSAGNIYIINSRMNCISKFDSTGGFIKKWGSAGSAPSEFQFTGPGDSLTVGPDGRLYVVDRGQARVQIFSLDGKYLEGFKVQWADWPDSIAVAKNGDIYLSVPPAIKLQNRFTIHLYKKNSNGFEFVREFSDAPAWLADDDLSRSETTAIIHLGISYVVCDEFANIYQVFRNLPIIRKFDSSGKMLWQKTIDIRKLPQMKGEHIIYFDLQMKPELLQRNNINSFERKIFSPGVAVSNESKRIYIFHTQKYAILEISFNGDLLGAYYPCDILQVSEDDIKNSNTIGKFWAFMNFAFDENCSRLLFIGLLNGELWSVYLNN